MDRAETKVFCKDISSFRLKESVSNAHTAVSRQTQNYSKQICPLQIEQRIRDIQESSQVTSFSQAAGSQENSDKATIKYQCGRLRNYVSAWKTITSDKTLL